MCTGVEEASGYHQEMALLDQIQKDMVAAMKASEQSRLDALRMIKSR
jgi:hypothetical protein